MAHPLDDLTPLTWTPATFDDIESIHGLLTAIYYFDEPAERWSVEDLEDAFTRAGAAVKETIFVGRDQDSIVALAWHNFIDYPGDRVRLIGEVHPAYRHQKIGRKMFAWQREAAWDWWQLEHPNRPLTMIAQVDEKLSGKRGLYLHSGMREVRWFIDMHCSFAEMGDRLDRALTLGLRGVRVMPFAAEYAESTRVCHNEAFGSVWGSEPIDEIAWAESLARSQSRPEWSWVALDDDDQVVGYALNASYGEDDLEGWTDHLGVRPGWRGLGLARILLARSLDSFRTAGLDGGGLGVDSHNGGGVELYRSIGYEATDTIIQYECIAPEDFERDDMRDSRQKGSGR
ncbi:GNAT family N-acetyltransferase [Enemella evansiae]|uniref:GNAT family N-acetyltransferase n=1 Tax=Enemella evansiae TaxID=2016499 RepID=UPI0010DF9B32|nr:GNAT family N-acetyltransferase [Enemella evansiae]TDO93230.1 L-amino acid N-acyltransferase YncA [Enemella evansiae]